MIFLYYSRLKFFVYSPIGLFLLLLVVIFFPLYYKYCWELSNFFSLSTCCVFIKLKSYIVLHIFFNIMSFYLSIVDLIYWVTKLLVMFPLYILILQRIIPNFSSIRYYVCPMMLKSKMASIDLFQEVTLLQGVALL